MPKDKRRFPDLGGFHSVKLGSGVLGKTAPLVGVTVLAIGAAILSLRAADPLLPFSLAAALMLLVAAYVAYAFWYGMNHPAAALLEGSELIRYKELDLRSNDPTVIDAIPVDTINTAPPQNFSNGDDTR